MHHNPTTESMVSFSASRVIRLLLATGSLVVFASQALAATTIGVNFQGRDGSGDVTGNPGTPPVTGFTAGAVPINIWNDVDDSTFTPAETGTTSALLDSLGNATTATLTFDCNDSWYNDVAPTNITVGNAMLMNGIIKVTPGKKVGAFIFNNLPEGTYDLYVYGDMNGDNVGMKVSDNNLTTSYYVVEQHQFYDTNTLVQGTNTDPTKTNDVCNYVKFSGLSTAGNGQLGAIVEWLRNADGIGIAGLELVNTGPATANAIHVNITSPPQNRRVLVGDTNVVLTIAVTGPVLGVQWYKNGTAIPGATDLSYAGVTTNGLLLAYALPAIVAGDNGAQFYAVVSNNVNTAQSSPGVITIGQLVPVPGVQEKLWYGATRATVEDGSHDSVTPDIQLALSTFGSPEEQGDNFGERLSCLFKPPVTANYTFFIAADDDSDLFLSTDSTPVNKTLIAQEVDWSNPLEWVSNAGGTGNHEVSQKRSDQWVPDPANPPASPPFANGIALDSTKTYYLEAVHHEGGGGDKVDVTFKIVGEPDPANDDASRINAFTTAAYPVGLNGAYIVVTNPPQNTTATQSRTATLTVGATTGYTGDNFVAGPAPAFQWQSAPSGSSSFANIVGANNNSYTTPILKLSDNGTQYRVAILAGDASTNSSVGVLTVSPDTVPPRPATVTKVFASGMHVELTFDELLDKASAETAANYVFSPGNIVATNASLDSASTTVTLLLGGPVQPTVTNVLTISGVKDLAGNPVAPNTTISFSFTLVTYEADILFDKPVGYYRFEDATTSSVAHNSGSKGGDGAYYLGDEASAGAGGVSTNAAGDPGPRPPAFAGFAADNHSARFTGSSANGGAEEWVDTKNQFLQGLNAFSLEYWCKPERTNAAYANAVDWGNRIGLVGQNDAIEYGFIDPATIQIWTPNGGSLNTTYSKPDDEWHHIATIADGASLKTYYDGVLVGTGGNQIPASGGYGTSIYNVHIGGAGVFDANGNYFIGDIDEVAIFTNAIPAARIAEHFSAGKNGGVITVSGTVTPPLAGGGPRLSFSRSGTTLTISWTPSGGVLQSATALSPTSTTWTDVGPANPATITIGSGSSFYRVKQ